MSVNGARVRFVLASARGLLAAAARVRRPDALTLALICIAAAGVALVFFRQSVYGVRVNGDAIHFIAIARSLLAGDGLLSWDGNYYGQWPPLPAFAFAAFGFGLADPKDVAGPLHAVAFGISILVAGVWLRRRVKSKWLVVWACACVVLARPVVEMAAWAYAEPLFILTGILALYWADRHFEDGKLSSLLLAAAFCGLHCLSRYMGIALLLTVIALLALRRGAAPRERLASAAAYALIGGVPLVIWALRNYVTVGFFLRYQDSSDTAFWEWIIPMMESMAKWWAPFVPVSASVGGGAAATMAAMAVAGALTLRAFVRWMRTDDDGQRFVLLTAGFSFASMALLLWGMTIGSIGMDRFLAPLFIPLTLATAFFADRGLARFAPPSRPPPDAKPAAARGLGAVARAVRAVQNMRARSWFASAVAAALAVWLVYGGAVSARHNWRETTAQGEAWRGWNWPPWPQLETTAYMQGRGEGGWVFSNVARLLYILSDESATYRSVPGGVENFTAELAERRGAPSDTFVAWFHDYTAFTPGRLGYNATHLRTMDGLEPAAAFYDGDVFRLNPNYKAADMPSGDTPPSASSYFDVYIEGGALIYEREPCAAGDADARFFVRALPVDLSDLPPESAADGYDNLGFDFWRYGALIGDRCVIRRPLPRYALRGIEVGQWIVGGGEIWRAAVEFPPDDAALSFYRDAYARTAAREPAARAEYDVYTTDNALIYLKDDCADSDTEGRFLLSVFPQDAADLPEARRDIGHDALNFDFARYGVRFDGKCLIRRPLPGYPTAAVEMGRWLPGEREVWRERLVWDD